MCRACSGASDLPSAVIGWGLWPSLGVYGFGGGWVIYTVCVGIWLGWGKLFDCRRSGGFISLLMESVNLFRRHDYVIHGKHRRQLEIASKCKQCTSNRQGIVIPPTGHTGECLPGALRVAVDAPRVEVRNQSSS